MVVSLRRRFPSYPLGDCIIIHNSHYIYIPYLSRVKVPMGASLQVHTTLKERESFSYANVRKASYRGSIIFIEKTWKCKILHPSRESFCDFHVRSMYVLCWVEKFYSNYSDLQHYTSIQVLRDLGNIPNLVRGCLAL